MVVGLIGILPVDTSSLAKCEVRGLATGFAFPLWATQSFALHQGRARYNNGYCPLTANQYVQQISNSCSGNLTNKYRGPSECPPKEVR